MALPGGRPRRRRLSGVPFAELSREEQVASMENLRGDGARHGAHASAEAQGTGHHVRNNLGQMR